MTDTTRVNELQDKILQAIDILNTKALNDISYDSTILCTIEDDTKKKNGEYVVTDGSVIFTAYSDVTTYYKGNQVYVTIPQGDYENQKVIIGKKTSENEEPVVFTKPFDTIFDMTGNLAAGAQADGALRANADNSRIKRPQDENGVVPDYDSITLVDMDIEPGTANDFNRLGLKANFKSLTRDAISGNYGLACTITMRQPATSGEEDVYTEYSRALDSSDMYGNPYNFETYYSQEKVFDLTGLGELTHIRIDFYQIKDTFKNQNGELLKYYYFDDNHELDKDESIPPENLLSPNLFVSDVYVCCGINLLDFETDYVQIYTQDQLTYNKTQVEDNDPKSIKLQRTIRTRWAHINEDNEQPIDVAAAGLEEEYEVRWYRYVIGAAAADNYSGVYWTIVGGSADWDTIISSLETQRDAEKAQVEEDAKTYNWTTEYAEKQKTEIHNRYQTQIDTYNRLKQDIINNSSIFATSDCSQIKAGQLTFYPDVNWQQEKIKVIILKDGVPYRSNILTFENEDLVPNKTTLIYENALEITTDDGTNGNYYVYGQDNNLLDKDINKEIKTLSLIFDTEGKGENWDSLSEEQYLDVIWTLPINNSMLEFTLSDGTKEPIKEWTSKKINSEKEFVSLQGAEENRVQLYQLNANGDREPINSWPQGATELIVYYEVETDFINYYQFNWSEIEIDNEEKFNQEIQKHQLYTEQSLTTLIKEYDTERKSKIYYYRSETTSLPQYNIKSRFSHSYTNNTISAQFTLNNIEYSTSKEFSFGPAGTMGTEQTIVIDFANSDQNAININTTNDDGTINKATSFIVRLYDANNREIEIPQTTDVIWSLWDGTETNNKRTVLLSKQIEGTNKYEFENPISVEHKHFFKDEKPSQDNLTTNFRPLVLKVEVGNLETYFPVPFKVKDSYQFITGATQVVYQTNGEPSFSSEEYGLYQRTDDGKDVKLDAINGKDIHWELCNVSGVTSGTNALEEYIETTIKTEAEFKQQKKFHTNIYYKNNNKYEVIDNFNNSITQYYYKVTHTPAATINNNKLKPISMYIENMPFYAVYANANQGEPEWIQTVLVMQNKWSSNVINKWDGNSIKIDHDEGYILSPAIAAGKKNDDNTFSGVMIGDWSKTDTNDSVTKQTGIYGFHEGAMSFSFTEDGKATIGKSGLGQIRFDGNEGLIESPLFETGVGMQIDLDEPYIFMKNNSTVQKSDDTGLVSNKSMPLQIGENFYVNWNGKLYASNGSFTGHIQADTGKIGQWEIVDDTDGSKGAVLQSSTTNTNKSIKLNANKGRIDIGNYMTLRGSDSQIRIQTDGKEDRGLVLLRNNNSGGLLQCGIIGLNIGQVALKFSDYDEDEYDTYNAGINTNIGNGHGIVLEADSNIRLTAKGTKLTFKNSHDKDKWYEITSSTSTSLGQVILEGKYIKLNATKLIEFDCEPENQKGIYARFA